VGLCRAVVLSLDSLGELGLFLRKSLRVGGLLGVRRVAERGVGFRGHCNRVNVSATVDAVAKLVVAKVCRRREFLRFDDLLAAGLVTGVRLLVMVESLRELRQLVSQRAWRHIDI